MTDKSKKEFKEKLLDIAYSLQCDSLGDKLTNPLIYAMDVQNLIDDYPDLDPEIKSYCVKLVQIMRNHARDYVIKQELNYFNHIKKICNCI